MVRIQHALMSQNVKNVRKVGYMEDVEEETRKKVARMTINTETQTKTDNLDIHTTFLYTASSYLYDIPSTAVDIYVDNNIVHGFQIAIMVVTSQGYNNVDT